MNPGAFVAGGGGNGGGKGGKGGKNGDGSEGAGTEDGDADANGDGNSADGCGAGSDGECNNCDTVIEAGDPVDVITGAVKTTPHRDLFLPAFFNLELRRTYSSSRIAEDVGLGWGWNHSFAWSFEEHRKHIFIRSGDGRVVEFPGLPDVGMEAFSGGWALRRIKGGFVLRPGNEFLHVFAKRKGHKHAYHLVRVGYRNRGHLSLQYEKGQLARIVDTAGRVVLFKRNSDGRVVSVSVPDPRGNTIIFAQYAYHPSGDLAAATDADGNTTYFFYDEAHRLTRLQYPNGITFHFRYDRVGRCFETWGERPGPDPALAPGLPETLADGTTVAKGIYHNHIAFTDEGYSELVDSVGMRRFEQGTDGKITTAVNERGGVTSRTLDDRGRVIEQVDANGSAWQWAYDYLGNVIKETDPLGGEMKVQRDHEGREVSITDQAGGQLTLERDGHGEVVGVVNQAGARLAFRRNARGRIVEVIDRRGARHLFEWDAHGNCTARTFPNGSTYRWTYDYWGRKLSETDPQGATASYAYTRRGRLIQMVDRIGRRITFDYDAMGNLVREILPDGSVTRHDYGGLNWCYQTVLPDGSTRRRLFNREGWMVRAENEVGQAHELEYEPDGRVRTERFADGRAHVFEYDLVGHLIAYDEGDGKYLRTLNAVGQVLETEAPDGSKRTFSYDSRGFVLSAELGGIKTEFERDATGVVTCERQIVDSTTYVLDTECDPEGEPTRLVSSLGFEQKLRRDGNGYVEQIYVSDMPTVRFERSLLGTVTRRELELQASIVDTLDVANRLKRREIVLPGAAKNSGQPEFVGAKPNAREWYYDYTQIDEIASVTEGNEHDAFEYDVRRHIKRRTSNAGRDEVFSVDPAGNYTAANGVTRTFKPGNQLRSHGNVSYTYDERGQLIEKTIHTDNTEETWEYTWNAWRQLEKVKRPDGTQIEYAYDAFSRRQAKRVLNRTGNIERHEHYVWNWTEIAHEVKLDAAGVLDSCRTYLYEDADRDNPIAHRDGEGAWVHYVGDLNDSPVELIDAAGRSLGRIDRASFGEQQARAGSSEDSRIAFPGQYVDGDIGLHYNRYRYYDPQAGRYISPDPIGFDGGWNFYAYGPNPVGWYDPLGTRHRMTVTGAPDGMIQHAEGGSGSTYASGMADCPTSGPTGSLRSRARCHTEQKLAHDMIAYDRAERAAGRPGLQGRTIRARGQYPPCPNCHRALQRAAAETGATVEYSWDHNGEENSITYSGHTAEFEGDAAVRLSEGYGMFQDPGRRNGYGFDSYYGEDSATAVYSELTGELPELED